MHMEGGSGSAFGCVLGVNIAFGKNTKIWQFTTIEDNVNIGDDVVIGSNCYIGKGTTIGSETHIQHGAFICRNAQIGRRSFIGPNVVLTDDKYPKAGNTDYVKQPPILRDGCSVGAGAVILPGITIGENALVGAGAVVAHDIPAGLVAKGVPATMYGQTNYVTDTFFHD